VWWPHPRPLPHGQGANTKKPPHVGVLGFSSTEFKTTKHKKQPKTLRDILKPPIKNYLIKKITMRPTNGFLY
ncbi:hypothetical protein ACVGW8_01320, partial [Enterobacter hormaechei]